MCMEDVNCDEIKDTFYSKLDEAKEVVRYIGENEADTHLINNNNVITELPKYVYSDFERNVNDILTLTRDYIVAYSKVFKSARVVTRLEAMIDRYGRICGLPDHMELYDEINKALDEGIRPEAERFVRAFTFIFDLDGSSHDDDDRYTEFPEVIERTIEDKKRLSFCFGNRVLDIDVIDVRNNKITNMCDLENIYSHAVYIEHNPIEKIGFLNKYQFLNVAYLNDFDDSNLPNDIKKGMKECKEQIETLIDLSRGGVIEPIKEPYSLSEITREDAEKIFTYTDACEPTYEKIENSGMCGRSTMSDFL